MKIQTTYIKDGKEETLKTPKIKLGNNLGEDEEIILDLKSKIYRNDFEFKNKQGNMQKGSTFSIKCEYNGQDLYAELTYVTVKTLEEYEDYIGHQFKFMRKMDGKKTKIEVTPMDDCPKGENQYKCTSQGPDKSKVEEMTISQLEEELVKFFNSKQLENWSTQYNKPPSEGGCPPERKSKEHFFTTIAKQWIPKIHDKVMKSFVEVIEV